ncbi:MAG: hypothetical protein ACO1RX_20985 [Candidatus Sericytochromatia bacterium]
MRRPLLALLLSLGLIQPARAQDIPMDLNADTLLVVRENRAEVWDRHTRRKRWERDISDPSPSPLGPGYSSALDCYAWLTPQSVMSLCQDSLRLQVWNIYTGQRERVWFLPGPLLGPLPVRSHFPTQPSNNQPPPQALIMGRPEIQVRTSAGQLQHTLFTEVLPERVLANSQQVVALLPGGRLQSWDLISGQPNWHFQAAGTGPFYLAWGERWGVISNGQGRAVVLTLAGQIAGHLQSPLFRRRENDHWGIATGSFAHSLRLLDSIPLSQPVHLFEEMVVDGDQLLSRSSTPQFLGTWLWQLPKGSGQNLGNHIPPQNGFGDNRLQFNFPWIRGQGGESWHCRLPTCTVRQDAENTMTGGGWLLQKTESTHAPSQFFWQSITHPQRSGYLFSELAGYASSDLRPSLLTPEHFILIKETHADHTKSNLQRLGTLTSVKWQNPSQRHDFEAGLMVHLEHKGPTPHLLAAGPEHIVIWGLRPALALWDHTRQTLSPLQALPTAVSHLVQTETDWVLQFMSPHPPLQRYALTDLVSMTSGNGPSPENYHTQHLVGGDAQQLWFHAEQPDKPTLLGWNLEQDQTIPMPAAQLNTETLLHWFPQLGLVQTPHAKKAWHLWNRAEQRWEAQPDLKAVPVLEHPLFDGKTIWVPENGVWRAF